MIALNFQVSQVGQWINISQQFSITQDQVKGLYKFFKEGKYRHPTTDSLAGPSKNNIDSLLNSMTSDSNCSVIWISSQKQHAESLITIKTSKKRRAHDKKIQEMRDQKSREQSHPTSDASMIEEQYDSSHLDEKKEDTPLKHSERILESLKLNQANRILLSLAWMDNQSLDKMACFPFVMGMDETDRTNCEERPLFCMVGMDSDNHIFPVLHILMPSKARWAYDWIYNEAIPYLIPERVRKNVQMLLTDQGKELVHMLSASVGDGNTFPNAIHRLCAWHIVDRNYNMEVKKHVPKRKAQSEIDKKFISDVCLWMYSFCMSIETKEHARTHLQQLYLFMQSAVQVTSKVRDFSMTFIKKSFEQVLEKVVFYNYMYRISGHVKTTSFVESHNARLHVSPTGPRPNHSLVTSVTRIRANCKRQSQLKEDLAERNADRRLTERTGKDDQETDVMNHAALVLSPHLTFKSVDVIMEQWLTASNFIFMEDDKFSPYIDDNGYEYTQCFLVTWNPKVPRWCHKTIPSWAYTRRVFKMEWKGNSFLKCNCGHCNRYGCACRHMYSLLSRKPEVSDSSPRCMKLYSLQYGKNDILSEAVHSYLQGHPFGAVPLLNGDVLGSCHSRGTNCAAETENKGLFTNWIQKTLTSVVAREGSAWHELSSTSPRKDMADPDTEEECIQINEYITQEVSGTEKNCESIPDMPVFVVEGAPVLMATPKKTSKQPCTGGIASPPPRGGTETLVQFKKRKRDECMSVFLELLHKAKTVNEMQHIIDKCNHTKLELNSKHAAHDAYDCIKDNIDGTISACVPITQSCNQGRLKKVNEPPASTKKKLKF
jgi:hypothetical protein